MRAARTWLALILCGCGVAWSLSEAAAQPTWLDLNRDCHVFVTCNYSRGGLYRGCLSSYSCRVCHFVPARCGIDAVSRICQRMVCTWG